jgi:hypothetical protein
LFGEVAISPSASRERERKKSTVKKWWNLKNLITFLYKLKGQWENELTKTV